MELKDIKLEYGAHDDPSKGTCIMEAVSLLAGEKHGYYPQCVANALIGQCMNLNDSLRCSDACGRIDKSYGIPLATTEERTKLLLPLIPYVMGTSKLITKRMKGSIFIKKEIVRDTEHEKRVEKILLKKIKEISPELEMGNIESVKKRIEAIKETAIAAKALLGRVPDKPEGCDPEFLESFFRAQKENNEKGKEESHCEHDHVSA